MTCSKWSRELIRKLHPLGVSPDLKSVMSFARRIHYARVLSVLIVLYSTDCTVSVRPKHTSNTQNKHTKKETLVAAWMTSRHSLKSIDYTKEFKQYFNTTLDVVFGWLFEFIQQTVMQRIIYRLSPHKKIENFFHLNVLNGKYLSQFCENASLITQFIAPRIQL